MDYERENPWRETQGYQPPEPSSPKQTKSYVSPYAKRLIGELGLRFPPPQAMPATDRAAQLALLCRDLADIPEHSLEKAIERWVRDKQWMPKAAELREYARATVTPRRDVGDRHSPLLRHRDEGNFELEKKGQLRAMQWIIEGSSLKLVDPKHLPLEQRLAV